MKYAFTTFSCPKATWTETLRLAREFGYDGIEPRAEQITSPPSRGTKHEHGVELQSSPVYRRTLRTQAENMDVEICSIATSCRFTDPSSAAYNVDLALDHLDLARDLDCPLIRVFPGAYPKEISREAAMDSLVNSLLQLAPYAQERALKVCVETHDSICDAPTMAAI